MKPKIRFKGFDDAYFENTFSQLFNTISDSGHNVSSNEYCKRGAYPVIDQSKDYIVGYTDAIAPIIPKGGIIVFGDHTRELKYVDFPFCTGADGTQLLSPKSKDIPMYLYYYCKSLKIPNTGYNRHFKYIKETIYKIPLSTKEQQAIASFFDNLDSQISASASRIASLKQIKAGSLQAMFPQEGETVPKVRFKGFKGEWDKVKLNTFAKRIMRKNSNLESTLALTIASAYGLVSQTDYFNNSLVGANLRNYYLLKKREFAYNKSYSNGYPFGSVKRLDRYEQGILSTLYIVFGIIDDTISSDYLTHFFDTTLWHKEVAERAAEGARNHGLLNIGAEDFLDINILKPQTKEEQQKIAVYFTSLDRQISLHSQRLEKLKQIKAACLDKMFV